MKERTNEENLDLFADLLEPATEIFSDKEIADMYKSGSKLAAVVSKAIKNHKSAIIEILALIDGVPVEDYKVNVITLPLKVLNLVNSKEFSELFTSQGQKNAAESFGSATGNIKGGAN